MRKKHTCVNCNTDTFYLKTVYNITLDLDKKKLIRKKVKDIFYCTHCKKEVWEAEVISRELGRLSSNER